MNRKFSLEKASLSCVSSFSQNSSRYGEAYSIKNEITLKFFFYQTELTINPIQFQLNQLTNRPSGQQFLTMNPQDPMNYRSKKVLEYIC